MHRSLLYTAKLLNRSRKRAQLRSGSIAIAAALVYLIRSQSDAVRRQAEQLAISGVSGSMIQRATFYLTLIALVVGALQIGIVMTRVVLQRMPEIGIMKAAGIRTSNIFWIFVFEALAYGAIGGITGAVVGFLLGIPASLPSAGVALQAAGITVGLSVVMALAAGVIPAIRATRISTVQAIAHAW